MSWNFSRWLSGNRILPEIRKIGAPYENRTRVSALRGPRPGPLDEGSVKRLVFQADGHVKLAFCQVNVNSAE